ncbi:acetyltransferase [Halalkalibacter akibai]|uniref:Transferase hexapeptide repeat n=1 Tax=Halalkalibacter akibai (strain ATCC 43226 / DSM 21942 / CIP 109018 / JCM 9157 / 1139) TaxID=1236973 RepID=W4QWB5_HALA3|nr:acetyltransferase [Halalkalibacter akibai]GAE35923.1 transferase hexapeptide repeat [Halalkalibacter akibai JCM 9157]
MKIVVIGQGGHSKVVSDLIMSHPEMSIIAYLDDKYDYFVKREDIYLGPISAALKLAEYFIDIKFVIAIGSNVLRKRIVEELGLPNDMYSTIIHPSAIVSSSVKLGVGTVIMPYVVINADAEIGDHAIINTRSVVEHDCKIDNFTHLSPNSILAGAVQVNEGVHIGTSATIIPNVKINEWSVVGASATVINDLPADCTAVGTPAKISMKEGEKLVK